MKTIIFICLITLFTSCTKDGINLGSGDWNWGGFGYPVINMDSSNIVKADIDSSGTIYHLSAVVNNTSFSRYVLTLYNDSSFISIYGSQANGNISLQLDLVNILTTGTYQFGQNPGHGREVKASFHIGNNYYYSDPTLSSGSITIDTITNKRIHGSFTVKCWKGTEAVNITNGSFNGIFF